MTQTDEERRAKKAAYMRAYVAANRDKVQAWRDANADRIRALQRKSYHKHRESSRARKEKRKAEFVVTFVGPPRPTRTAKTVVELRESAKTYSRKWNDTHPGYLAEMYRKSKEAMTPAHIANFLKIPVADLTPELLTMKREQLSLHRLGKQLKAQIQESK